MDKTIPYHLYRFDKLALERNEKEIGISQELFDAWRTISPLESTASIYARMSQLKAFSGYLRLMGINSFMPKLPKLTSDFIPHIFTQDEISRLIRECDKLTVFGNMLSTCRFYMPTLIRVLYATGIRVGEAISLTNQDVQLSEGIIKIRESKNCQERLIPVSTTLLEVCKDYMAQKFLYGLAIKPSDRFFCAPDGSPATHSGIAHIWRMLIQRAEITCCESGNHPRIHDLRHTFCVKSLKKMCDEGLDLYSTMPVLMTYMGHKTLDATNRYLRLTQELYPELRQRSDELYKYICPDTIDIIEP